MPAKHAWLSRHKVRLRTGHNSSRPLAFSRCLASRLATLQFYSSVDASETRTKPADFALLPLGAVRVGPSHINSYCQQSIKSHSPSQAALMLVLATLPPTRPFRRQGWPFEWFPWHSIKRHRFGSVDSVETSSPYHQWYV